MNGSATPPPEGRDGASALPGGGGAPEMSRPLPLARIGADTVFAVEASAEEQAKLASRMGLVALQALTCRFMLRRGEDFSVHARGQLRARVTQTCVVSLDPFEADIAEDFSVRFVPAGSERHDLDLEADDEIGYADGAIDLGEAASEQLALALDPFPRKPGAILPEAVDSPQTGHFAALALLRAAAMGQGFQDEAGPSDD